MLKDPDARCLFNLSLNHIINDVRHLYYRVEQIFQTKIIFLNWIEQYLPT